MTELIRQAVRSFRMGGGKLSNSKKPSYHDILEMTKGSWSNGDALEWHKKFQAE